MIKKGKREDELPKGVKGEHPMTNFNHASEEDKVSAYSPDEVQGIKKELAGLQDNALYRRTSDLVNEGKLGPDDWHVIDYQGIYERLMYEQFDILKLKTLNARWRIAMGLATKSAIRGTGDAAQNFTPPKVKRRNVPNAGEGDFYFPGPIKVWQVLSAVNTYKTLSEIGNQAGNEQIFQYGSGYYARAEEAIRAESHDKYIELWESMREDCMEEIESSQKPDPKAKEFLKKCETALVRGPNTYEILEVLDMIRRQTFVSPATLNPGGYIPFRNGILNLATRQLEPFTPELFFTYRVEADYLDHYVTLNDTPMFRDYLNQVYYDTDIPMILSYDAYSFYPVFPVHRVLFILGRERVGKGTGARILRGLMPVGFGSVQLDKLLLADRFMFTGIIGKNLIVDAEIKRRFKRGMVKDWKHFNELFGGDTIQNEMKGHEGQDYVSSAKGIFIGNLPFFEVDNPAAASRILLIETRNEKPKKVIPDLDKKILDAERNEIATLLMQILFKLVDREFLFPGEMTPESTMEVLDRLADPVENFIEEATEESNEDVPADKAHNAFETWCDSKGIPALPAQTFKKKFSRVYPKKLRGTRQNREYVFTGCRIFDLESGDQTQDHLQVEHGGNPPETAKTSLSGNRYRRVQHASQILRIREGEKTRDQVTHHVTWDKVHMLNTGVTDAQKPLNSASADDKKRVQLPNEPDKLPDQRPSEEDGKNENILGETPVPDAIPDKNPITLDQGKDMSETHENPKFYTYVVLKDFKYNGHVYSQGIEFILREKLTNYVNEGILMLKEGPA